MKARRQALRDERKKLQEERELRQIVRSKFISVVPQQQVVVAKPIAPKITKIIKRGLLIGINYTGTGNQLNGCINDSTNLAYLLYNGKYIPKENLIMMNDNQKGDLYPSKVNIMKQFANLVAFANNNKDAQIELFLSYSGHGTYVKSTNNDEADGRDEALCPIDCDDPKNFIIDDDIKAKFIDLLPANVKIFVLIDACHSGTIFDLKYNYAFGKKPSNITSINTETRCDVVMISGCRDNQTSADAYLTNYRTNSPEYEGAMTASFLKIFKDNITYDNLVPGMVSWLDANQYDQVPQLSSGKLIDLKAPVFLSIYNDN